MDKTFTIGIEDDACDTLFYVSARKWSPEYPDAHKFTSRKLAEHFLANMKRMRPEDEKYQRAYII